MKNNTAWHALSAEEAQTQLKASANGLSAQKAASRLEEIGRNKLPEAKPDSILVIFLRQFQSPLIYLLVIATVVVVFLEEWVDAGVIAFVLLFNAVVGAIQAGKAQNTLMALRNFAVTSATVLRNGKEVIIPDEEVVPGDIIILQEGEKVPADARILFSHNLRANEAALTGESVPVGKNADAIGDEKAPVSEQKNMAFKGTHIVAGNGKALVVATGLDTYIGKISKKISKIDTEIPLQTSIRNLTKIIIATILVVSVVVFAIGWLEGKDLTEMFKLAVAVVVSAIPEGLPIVMTLVLAHGVWRMSKRNVLVKRLQAVEALGEAKIIAVDKTGTITKGELVVQSIYIPPENSRKAEGKMLSVSGVGYETKGTITHEDKPYNPKDDSMLASAARISAFTSNARLSYSGEDKKWKVAGDPTEAALLVFAEKTGISREQLLQEAPQVDEIPFDPKLKYHAALHKDGSKKVLAIAGAPEEVLALCKVSVKERKRLEEVFADMSRRGLRVLALAQKENFRGELAPENIRSLKVLALVGMHDALRAEVHDAIAATREAGIKVRMITGDHKITAEAIAKDAGIFTEGDDILTGEEMNELSDKQLAKRLDTVTVFARVTPEHKLRIIKAYRIRGEVISMTGDGVNDALSLVAADLGVAMGVQGTEVAKEAADLILLDDNFGSIAEAVEEGRRIFANVRKVVSYLLTTSTGELFIIFGALLLGWPLPITAVQLIWLNLVTDGVLDVGLAMEPQEKDRRWHRRVLWGKRKLIDNWVLTRLGIKTVTMGVATLILFSFFFESDFPKAMTIAVTTMAAFQWKKVWNFRSEFQSVFRMGVFTNKYLVWATIAAVGMQVAAIYTPFLQSILGFVPLSLAEWALCISVAFSTVVIDETNKYFRRRWLNKQMPASSPSS